MVELGPAFEAGEISLYMSISFVADTAVGTGGAQKRFPLLFKGGRTSIDWARVLFDCS